MYAASASRSAASLVMIAVPRLRRMAGVSSGCAISVCASADALTRATRARANGSASAAAGH